MDPRVTLAAAATSLLLASGSVAQEGGAPSPIAGKWYSYQWGGFAADANRRCLIATVIERDYEIVPDRMGTRGTFTSVTWSFVWQGQPPCQVGGQTLRPAEMTARFWGLNGYGASVPMRVSAGFQKCAGMYCSDPQTDKRDFTADLRRVGNELIETDEDNPAWRQIYRPLDAYQGDLGRVRAAAEQIRAALATGDPDKLAPLLSAAMQPAIRNSMLSGVAPRREQAALVEAIEPIMSFVAAPGADIKDPRVSAVAFMTFAARRVDDTKFGGHFIFTNEGGEWKLFAMVSG